jgi:hypothetical protein
MCTQCVGGVWFGLVWFGLIHALVLIHPSQPRAGRLVIIYSLGYCRILDSRCYQSNQANFYNRAKSKLINRNETSCVTNDHRQQFHSASYIQVRRRQGRGSHQPVCLPALHTCVLFGRDRLSKPRDMNCRMRSPAPQLGDGSWFSESLLIHRTSVLPAQKS